MLGGFLHGVPSKKQRVFLTNIKIVPCQGCHSAEKAVKAEKAEKMVIFGVQAEKAEKTCVFSLSWLKKLNFYMFCI